MNEYLMQEEQELHVDIREYWLIIRQRRWIIASIMALVMTVTIIRTFTQQKLYTSQAQIQIESDSIRIVDDITGSGQSQIREFYNTQYKLLNSKSIYEEIVRKLDFPKSEKVASLLNDKGNFSPTSIASLCTISPVQNTQLVDIIYTACDPELAAKLANLHTNSYIESNIRKKTETTVAASEFITEQIQTLQKQIQEDERILQEYIKQEEMIKGPDQETVTLAKLQRLDVSLTDAETNRMSKESYYRFVTSTSHESLPEVQSNDLIKQLQKEYSQLEKEYNLMAQRFQPDWPELKRLKANLDQTSQRLASEIDRMANLVIESARLSYENALENENEFRKRLQEQKSEVQNMESSFVQYNTLKMRIDNKKKILAELLVKESETEVTARLKGLKTSNIWTVEQATPSGSPSHPRIKLNLLLGLLIGSGLGFGLAFFLEYLDNTVKSSEDVERYLHLPFLGFIPAMRNHHETPSADRLLPGKVAASNGNGDSSASSKRGIQPIDLISMTHPKSHVAEAFKTIRTSILLSSDNFSPRKILVTSSQPGEGKTTTALNLAITLTQLDKKVVLIDADLRNPRVHKILELDNSFGLANFIQNTLDPKLLIKKCRVENLGIITSGTRPQNPSELLSSSKMMQLLEKLTQSFDHIVIDSPPVLAVADSLILGKLSESIILIVHGEKTSRDTVAKARDRFTSLNMHIQGVVVNNVDTSPNSYYYYYYYPYKYTYGEGPNQKDTQLLES